MKKNKYNLKEFRNVPNSSDLNKSTSSQIKTKPLDAYLIYDYINNKLHLVDANTGKILLTNK